MSDKGGSSVYRRTSKAAARKGRAGAILLLSLLVMSGVLVVGASLGTISLLSLRQARVIDDSVAAFGAAETAAEQTLYQLRRAGEAASALNAGAANEDGESGSLTGPAMRNGSSWFRSLAASEPAVFASIPLDRSYEIVLWDPENPNAPAGVASMSYAWEDACGGTSALEVMATGWDPASVGTFEPLVAFHGEGPSFTFMKQETQVVDNGFSPGQAYRVRFRAKNCDVLNLTVVAYSADDAGGGVVQIPSRIAVTAEGTFGAARQGMELRLPRLQPLSGVFDFVIFSQCSILKGVAGTC